MDELRRGIGLRAIGLKDPPEYSVRVIQPLPEMMERVRSLWLSLYSGLGSLSKAVRRRAEESRSLSCHLPCCEAPAAVRGGEGPAPVRKG